MKFATFVSGIAASLALSQVGAGAVGERVSGFQCVGINIAGLHLTADDLRTGAKFPWVRDAPREDAGRIGQVSSIIYVAWPVVPENGFVRTMMYNGKTGWLEEEAIRPLHRTDGTVGGCTLSRRPDGRIMFSLDPGVGIKN
jgi:hypothetical protein